jgi:hypothetical protein
VGSPISFLIGTSFDSHPSAIIREAKYSCSIDPLNPLLLSDYFPQSVVCFALLSVGHNLKGIVLVMTRLRLMDDSYFAGDYIHIDKHPRTQKTPLPNYRPIYSFEPNGSCISPCSDPLRCSCCPVGSHRGHSSRRSAKGWVWACIGVDEVVSIQSVFNTQMLVDP